MATAAARISIDPYLEATYDPFEDDMGESSLQRFISEHLRPRIEEYLRALRGPTFVGADQYVGWVHDDGEKVLAPDVYVLPGVEPGEEFEFWKVWQTGIVPSFALEIVSKRKKKDYTEVPPLYGELGVEELVIFDPRYKRRRGGVRFQVYRRLERRGFVRVEATNADRVRSRVLGCWLRVVGEGKEQRIRLATDPSGEAFVPTEAEARLDAVRAEAAARVDAAQAEAAAKVDAAQAEAAARVDAAEAKAAAAAAKALEVEAEIARLRAELARKDGSRPRRE